LNKQPADVQKNTTTYDRESLALLLFPRWEVFNWHLKALVLDGDTRGHSMGVVDPGVQMRGVFDLHPYRQTLILGGEEFEGVVTRDESGCAESDRELITGPIIVPDDLGNPFWNGIPVERGHSRRGQFIERGVDVPAVETGVTLGLVLGRDNGLVEFFVGGVVECRVGNTDVVVDLAVADELHLRNAWDLVHLKQAGGDLGDTRVEVVAVAVRSRIERLRAVI
jgi:hypothetical protein